jgi:Ca2+-binding RTX toxin-like protein
MSKQQGTNLTSQQSAALQNIPLGGDAEFDPAITFFTGGRSDEVTTGDFNGDGNLDLAAGGYSFFIGSSISVLLGDGTGNFTSPATFSTGFFSSPSSIAVGDFNGDSSLDLVATAFGNNVSVLLGDGTGSFGSATNLFVGSNNYSVATADFNGDSFDDLAIASDGYIPGTVTVLLADGTGNFGSVTSLPVGNDPEDVAVGDFNGDGNLDLIAANENYFSKSVSVLLGDGSGNFGASTEFSTVITPGFVAVGDFNGDGNLDAATTNSYSYYGSNNISVLLGDGSGGFGAATTFAVSRSTSLEVGDFNSDSNLDLVLGNFGVVSVLLGDGTGSFDPATSFGIAGAYSIAVGDFDQDGRPDLVTASRFNGVSVLLNASAPPTEVVGTNRADTLIGTERANIISGLGGDDAITALGGRDQVFGGDGADVIDAGAGSDAAEGGKGNDQISGGDGDDSLSGGDGVDVIFGDNSDGSTFGNDQISGGAGGDRLFGGSGNDQINGDTGNDNIDGGSDSDQLFGDDGNDIIEGGNGFDILSGGLGDDQLSGGFDNDQLLGDAGNDQIIGDFGFDRLEGGDGNDFLSGGNDADTLLGGTGKDRLIGGLGSDTLSGDDGNDELIGVDSAAVLAGFGAGLGENDVLSGGAGKDKFVLGDVNQVYYKDNDPVTEGGLDFAYITDFTAGEDTIQLKGPRSFYSLDFFPSSTGVPLAAINYDPGVEARSELIGILQNAPSSLKLTNASFVFV